MQIHFDSGWFTSAQIQANLGELLNQSNKSSITQCSCHVKLKVYNSLTGKQSEFILQDLTTQAVGCTHIEFEHNLKFIRELMNVVCKLNSEL